MKIYRILSFIMVMCFLISCDEEPTYKDKISNYHTYLNQGKLSLDENNPKQAIANYNAAIEITDTLPRAYTERGKALHQLEYYEEAIEDFNEAIDLEGDKADKSSLYKYRALSYAHIDGSEFKSDIDHYLEFHPKDFDAIRYRIYYNIKNENFEDAIEDCTTLLKAHKNSCDLLLKRSNLYIKNGDYDLAIIDLKSIENKESMFNKYKSKIVRIKSLDEKRSKARMLLLTLCGVHILYLIISNTILKSIATEKAKKHVGPNQTLASDPIIFLLPLILAVCYYYITTKYL